MLGYTKADIDNMKYGIDCAIELINPDENPAIHRYLTEATEFFNELTDGYN
jgi:hypothetical protein